VFGIPEGGNRTDELWEPKSFVKWTAKQVKSVRFVCVKAIVGMMDRPYSFQEPAERSMGGTNWQVGWRNLYVKNTMRPISGKAATCRGETVQPHPVVVKTVSKWNGEKSTQGRGTEQG